MSRGSGSLPDLASELDLIRHTPARRVLADLEDVPGVPKAVMDRI